MAFHFVAWTNWVVREGGVAGGGGEGCVPVTAVRRREQAATERERGAQRENCGYKRKNLNWF